MTHLWLVYCRRISPRFEVERGRLLARSPARTQVARRPSSAKSPRPRKTRLRPRRPPRRPRRTRSDEDHKGPQYGEKTANTITSIGQRPPGQLHPLSKKPSKKLHFPAATRKLQSKRSCKGCCTSPHRTDKCTFTASAHHEHTA